MRISVCAVFTHRAHSIGQEVEGGILDVACLGTLGQKNDEKYCY